MPATAAPLPVASLRRSSICQWPLAEGAAGVQAFPPPLAGACSPPSLPYPPPTSVPPLLSSRDAGVQAIFFGHDHDNCFYGELDGVRVGYGRKTGVGNYGPPR